MKHLDPLHWVAFSDRKYFGLAAKRTQSLSAVPALLISSLSQHLPLLSSPVPVVTQAAGAP